MATVTLEMTDSSDFDLLLRIAEKFGAKLIKKKQSRVLAASSKFKSKEEFWSLFGIGKNNPVSLSQIREKAWGRK